MGHLNSSLLKFNTQTLRRLWPLLRPTMLAAILLFALFALLATLLRAYPVPFRLITWAWLVITISTLFINLWASVDTMGDYLAQVEIQESEGEPGETPELIQAEGFAYNEMLRTVIQSFFVAVGFLSFLSTLGRPDRYTNQGSAMSTSMTVAFLLIVLALGAMAIRDRLGRYRVRAAGRARREREREREHEQTETLTGSQIGA